MRSGRVFHRRKGIRAFTFIEMLLVASIFSVLGLAIFSSLTSGLRLWDRTQRMVLEEDAVIFFDKFSADLRNSFLFSRIPFLGEEMTVSFPTIVYTKADSRSQRVLEGYVDQIGSVKYSFDPASGFLTREEANYSQSVKGEFLSSRVMVRHVSGLRFRYFYSGQKDSVSGVSSTDELPSGVEVEIRFSQGETEKVLRRYVNIPMGA